MVVENKIFIILQKIKTMPTIMLVEQENKIIEQVLSLSYEEIKKDEFYFYKILESLYLSHEYNWFLLSNDDIILMDKFIAFLLKCNFLSDREFIDDVLWIFSLNPENPPK